MLSGMNREEAKYEFSELAAESDYLNDHWRFPKYPIERNRKETFKWYTDETFFYHVLNKGLRKF